MGPFRRLLFLGPLAFSLKHLSLATAPLLSFSSLISMSHDLFRASGLVQCSGLRGCLSVADGLIVGLGASIEARGVLAD